MGKYTQPIPYIDDLIRIYIILVPMAGVEPAQLSPLPPQDSVSTNSTTSAILLSIGYNYIF